MEYYTWYSKAFNCFFRHFYIVFFTLSYLAFFFIYLCISILPLNVL